MLCVFNKYCNRRFQRNMLQKSPQVDVLVEKNERREFHLVLYKSKHFLDTKISLGLLWPRM